jgi:hypothetical protein
VSSQPLTALAAAAGAAGGGEEHWLLTGGKDRGVSLWRVGGGEQRALTQAAALRGHVNSVAALSLLPEGAEAAGEWVAVCTAGAVGGGVGVGCAGEGT